MYAGSDLRGQERKHFVVVPLDGDFRVGDMAPSIQALKKAAANSGGAVGVGIVSMMGFEHTRNELAVSHPPLTRQAKAKAENLCKSCFQYCMNLLSLVGAHPHILLERDVMNLSQDLTLG